MSEEKKKKKTNIFCNAKQKESGVELRLKGVEDINWGRSQVPLVNVGLHYLRA